VVRSGFASDTTHFMRFVYHSPVKYLVTISPDQSARAVTWLAEGTPRHRLAARRLLCKQQALRAQVPRQRTVARELWERSERLLTASVNRGTH
jgi:hypothetical protein